MLQIFEVSFKSHSRHMQDYYLKDSSYIMKRLNELKKERGHKKTLERNSLTRHAPVCFLSPPSQKQSRHRASHMKPSAFLAADCLPFPEGHLVNAHLSFHGLLTSF